MCADLLGWTPRDVDKYSFYDIAIALKGAKSRIRREAEGQMRAAMAISTAIYNWGAPRSKKFKGLPFPNGLFDKVTGRRTARKQMSPRQISALLSAMATRKEHG